MGTRGERAAHDRRKTYVCDSNGQLRIQVGSTPAGNTPSRSTAGTTLDRQAALKYNRGLEPLPMISSHSRVSDNYTSEMNGQGGAPFQNTRSDATSHHYYDCIDCLEENGYNNIDKRKQAHSSKFGNEMPSLRYQEPLPSQRYYDSGTANQLNSPDSGMASLSPSSTSRPQTTFCPSSCPMKKVTRKSRFVSIHDGRPVSPFVTEIFYQPLDTDQSQNTSRCSLCYDHQPARSDGEITSNPLYSPNDF